MVLSLAPAMLTLFGRAVWWLPGWLDKLLPHVDIEGESGPPTRQPPAPVPPTPGPAVQPRRPGVAAGTAPPDGNGPATGRPAGLGIPGSEPWPEPPTPIRDATGPGNGSGRGDPPDG
jgi:hypothetical protein